MSMKLNTKLLRAAMASMKVEDSESKPASTPSAPPKPSGPSSSQKAQPLREAKQKEQASRSSGGQDIPSVPTPTLRASLPTQVPRMVLPPYNEAEALATQALAELLNPSVKGNLAPRARVGPRMRVDANDPEALHALRRAVTLLYTQAARAKVDPVVRDEMETRWLPPYEAAKARHPAAWQRVRGEMPDEVQTIEEALKPMLERCRNVEHMIRAAGDDDDLSDDDSTLSALSSTSDSDSDDE